MKNNLMSGALALSVGGVLAKIFSAAYRIVLTRILGGEGIGIYQLIFPVYSLFVVLATAGLPMAISKVIAKNKGKEESVLKKCFMVVGVFSLILAGLLTLFSKILANFQGQKDIFVCYLILAPTIIVIGVTSVLRGYFQGKHNFIPSAISNILEQFIKFCVGIVLSFSLLGAGLINAIIGAVVGIAVSEIVSLFVLVIFIKKEKNSKTRGSNVSIKTIFQDVFPITLLNIVLPFSSFVDSLIVVKLLSFSFSNKVSVFLYGLESGAVASLVGLPTIFSFAIASVVLPNIAHETNIENRSRKLDLALKLILIITVPCVVCFVLFSQRILSVLYGGNLRAFGIDGIKVAAKLLAIGSLGVVFLAINQVYSSCLQAVEERFAGIRNLIIAVVVKLVVEVLFLPSKVLNIYTMAIAGTACYLLVMMLNRVEIKNHFVLKFDHLFCFKLISANVIMVLTVVLFMSFSALAINTVISIIIGTTVYLFVLFKIKIFNNTELKIFRHKVE